MNHMKTVVRERDGDGPGAHRYHAGFPDYARHCGFVIKLCRPSRARTKGKIERFNGDLRRSFYVPLATKLKRAGLQLEAMTANTEVRHWIREVAHQRLHGTIHLKAGIGYQRSAPASRRFPSRGGAIGRRTGHGK